MNKHHPSASWRIVALALLGGLIVSSCADTFDDDETFQSSVKNAQLQSPNLADITVTPSSDGSQQTITWPVVHGAGGYEVKLYNAGSEELLRADTIDGCSATYSREEDTNYRLELRTLGNQKLNNTEAAEATKKEFTTFTETFATIPEGDLYQWFKDNPIPVDSIGVELNFDLEGGGAYTLSKPLDLGGFNIVLRTPNKDNHAVITFSFDANFVVSAEFTLKYVDVDASQSPKAFIELSKTPIDSLKPEGVAYARISSIRLLGGSFSGLRGSLIYDNNQQYCVANLLISNCIIREATVKSEVRNEAFISFQGGGIKDFTITNSTVYQTSDEGPSYFIRYNNSARVDRFGWTTADHTTMNYSNNTFYKANTGQWGNYSGISNYSTYTVIKNIFVDCGDGQTARRMMGNSRLGNNSSATYSYNTYWRNGEQSDQGNYDTGTVLTTDPAFVDAAAGDFTPTGAEQLERQTGDPRWLP